MEFRLLGPLEVVDDESHPIEIRGAKLRMLVGALVLRAGQPVSADHLAEVLWGDSPPAAAGNALQAQISKLRRTLAGGGGASPVEMRDGGYVLAIDPSAIDANRFAQLAVLGRQHLDADLPGEAADVLRDALALWRGPALADFVYDDFAEADRVRLDELRLAATEDRVDADLALGHHDAVIPEIEMLVSESPLRERFWGQLMLALYRAGRQADALRAFQRVKERLAEDLGLDPGPALRELERQILDHDASLAAPTSASRPRSPALTNVHAEINSFVGREAELDALSTTIRDRRLVTVVGPGGVGKTRLAIEAAVRTRDEWRDGTWLVELGQWAGAAAVGDAFARTFGPRLGTSMGGRTSAERVEEWLIDGLASAELLIVLDNCEHVLGDAARIAHALTRSCLGVHILATSREAFGAPGETVRPLGPLDLDDAIALFATRAADSSSFVLDDTSAPSVERICSRVDRLPLAIELTAARTRAFSATQLADLIHTQFGLVSSASSTRPARQQTLDAAVEWSYELLFEDERRLLARLSVFAGSFTLESAIAVVRGRPARGGRCRRGPRPPGRQVARRCRWSRPDRRPVPASPVGGRLRHGAPAGERRGDGGAQSPPRLVGRHHQRRHGGPAQRRPPHVGPPGQRRAAEPGPRRELGVDGRRRRRRPADRREPGLVRLPQRQRARRRTGACSTCSNWPTVCRTSSAAGR